jgi:hypothetical protein
MTDFGEIWKPVTKSGAYPAHYFRKKHVSRSSGRVKAVNEKFASAAKSCEGNHTSDKSFQQCMRDKMSGFTAPGEDAESYKYAKKIRQNL